MATNPNLLDPNAVPPPADPTAPPYTPVAVPPPAGASPSTGLLATTVGTAQQPLPPIDPNTYENDSSVSRLNDIVSKDSPYMQLARTSGLQTANKRGLLNSSIAAGASEGAAIQFATPLATTDAQIAGQRNLARVQAYFTGQQQAADIASREKMLGLQLSNEQLLQTRDIAAKLQMQGIDITNQQQMQQAQISATKDLTQMNIQAEMDRLGRQLTSQEEMQVKDISAQQARLAMSIASQEKISTNELTNQLNIANLDANTRVQLQTMQNLSEAQRTALQYYLGEDQIYAQTIGQLWANADLPAPARDQALSLLTVMKNSGVNLPAALFGLNFAWPSQTGGTTSAPMGGSDTTATSSTTPTTGGATSGFLGTGGSSFGAGIGSGSYTSNVAPTYASTIGGTGTNAIGGGFTRDEFGNVFSIA